MAGHVETFVRQRTFQPAFKCKANSVNRFGGNRVLVVEPDSWSRVLLVDFLKGAGFETEAAADAAEALHRAESFDPHVLLSNYQLADGASGIDLALALRRLNGLLGLVFLSKLPERDLGLLPGADLLTGAQYFSSDESFSSDGLLDAVTRALSGAGPSKH